jgi:hypothetical protein
VSWNDVCRVHDYLYDESSRHLEITREEADVMLRKGIAEKLGREESALADTFYVFVRQFGASHYEGFVEGPPAPKSSPATPAGTQVQIEATQGTSFLEFGVRITSHLVQSPFRFMHTAIEIVPEDQDWCRNHSDQETLGTCYFTISAGPTSLIGGYLGSDLNRPSDNPANNDTIINIDPPDGMTEAQLIDLLLQSDQNFNDNSLDYEYFPLSWTDGHNSNSYVSGLLAAAGITAPALDASDYPGWSKPVPSENFTTSNSESAD